MWRRKCPLAVVAMARPGNQEEAVGRLMDVRGARQAESVQSMKRLAVSAPESHCSDQLKAQRNRRVASDPKESSVLVGVGGGSISPTSSFCSLAQKQNERRSIFYRRQQLRQFKPPLEGNVPLCPFLHPTRHPCLSVSPSTVLSFIPRLSRSPWRPRSSD